MDQNSYNFIKRSIKKSKLPLEQAHNPGNNNSIKVTSHISSNNPNTANIEKMIRSIKKNKFSFSPTLIPKNEISKIKHIYNNKDRHYKIFNKKHAQTSKKNNKNLTYDIPENKSVSQLDLQKQSHQNYPKSKQEIAIQNLYKLSIADSYFPSTNVGILSGWTSEFNHDNKCYSKKKQVKTNRSTILDQRKRKSSSTNKQQQKISHIDLFDFKQNLQNNLIPKSSNQRNIITQIQPQVFIKKQNYVYFKNSIKKNRKRAISSCRAPCQQYKNTSNLLGNKNLWSEL